MDMDRAIELIREKEKRDAPDDLQGEPVTRKGTFGPFVENTYANIPCVSILIP